MQPETTNTPTPKSQLTIPIAIIIAGAIIAVAVIFTQMPAKKVVNNYGNADQTASIPPVTKDDHILGNPNAKIKIVEYSDPSCPFCKMFNTTMERVMTDYGNTGNVAWVYRHFPLDKPDSLGHILHPHAGNEAQALECAATLAGNQGFWSFEKRLYEVTPSVTGDTPDGLDPAQLPVIAKYVGIDPTQFSTCLAANADKDKIEKEYEDGANAGVQGTPYSFIVTSDGAKPVEINGAQSYQNMKAAIDSLIASQ